MKKNNIELFLIIILIIKSKNDSAPNNISTIFSINPINYSTNEIDSYTNISLTTTNIISTINNNKTIFQSNSSISSMNTTFINVNHKILGQTLIFTNTIIETTIPKIKQTFPIFNKMPDSLAFTNTFKEPNVYISENINSLFLLQVHAIDYFLNIYLFYEEKYPNSLKTSIYVDTPSENEIIIRERLFVIANYTRNKNHIIEYTSALTDDYQNTQNFSVTIKNIYVVEDENDNKNNYDIYLGVDENNLNTKKAENLINNGSFNFSNIFNMTNYNYSIYDVYDITKGCDFFINLSENRTIYNEKKTIEINFTEYNNGSTINAYCNLSSEYTDQIPCSTKQNITKGNYTFKPFVYPFEDEIFIFKQKKGQVFHLFCLQKNEIYKTSKLVVITTILSISISIGFLIILVVACFKHRDNLSPVSNKSEVVISNNISKEVIVDSTMSLNK